MKDFFFATLLSTVSSDGTITARDDNDLVNENRFEVVQVNNLPSQDAFQASPGQHLQQSYIIQTVPHPSSQVTGNTYTIIQSPSGQFVRQASGTELAQEPQNLDGTPIQSEQVHICGGSTSISTSLHKSIRFLSTA